MKIIVGLGNPGGNYESTRHNIGFMVVDKLSREIGKAGLTWTADPVRSALIARTGDVLLVKPQSFMNKSGLAVRRIMDFYKAGTDDIWIIHDDIDLPLGKIRIRGRGASGGHNGVDSVILELGTDVFTRFRLGIGRGKESTGVNSDRNLKHRSVISFVLSHFHDYEAGSFKHLVKNGADAVRTALIDGIDAAMRMYN
ncbi:aminoacyl-tRNA hydrolase [Candidatus Gottesmanbacteria bacterium RBG_16_52_11]|uniref:Peptidyl-tRNA hydrolase n=1 Tax=Candidatus Gottesmanbacteria bacterium RBG_16_52_11 TaxID=1798374 RepID=A0A1F5YVD8_9BACT|nr:MAG: aminoacyl-tRNA hydrolase [Candidatus Gottesmanbacteria bacterium RBG_16_52_11]